MQLWKVPASLISFGFAVCDMPALESSYMTYILQLFQIDLQSASQLQRFSEILRRLRNAKWLSKQPAFVGPLI